MDAENQISVFIHCCFITDYITDYIKLLITFITFRTILLGSRGVSRIPANIDDGKHC